MAKRSKLTKRQRRQVSDNLSRRLNKDELASDDQLGEPQAGLVIGRFGQHADIEDLQGDLHRCHIRRNVQDVVCGVWRRPNYCDCGCAKALEAALYYYT